MLIATKLAIYSEFHILFPPFFDFVRPYPPGKGMARLWRGGFQSPTPPDAYRYVVRGIPAAELQVYTDSPQQAATRAVGGNGDSEVTLP